MPELTNLVLVGCAKEGAHSFLPPTTNGSSGTDRTVNTAFNSSSTVARVSFAAITVTAADSLPSNGRLQGYSLSTALSFAFTILALNKYAKLCYLKVLSAVI